MKKRRLSKLNLGQYKAISLSAVVMDTLLGILINQVCREIAYTESVLNKLKV